jgi:hypothetical protein
VSRRSDAIHRLHDIRNTLQKLLDATNALRWCNENEANTP